MQTAPFVPIIRSVGLNGLLVTFGARATDAANRAAIAFRAEVDAMGWSESAESSSTLVSAVFRVDLAEHDFDAFKDRLAEVLATRDWSTTALPSHRTLWTIPAVFGGERAPQLAEAAEAAGLNVADAQAALTSTRLRVLTLGFAPGQPYLGTLGEAWDIPRQVGLSPNIPAGALVAAAAGSAAKGAYAAARSKPSDAGASSTSFCVCGSFVSVRGAVRSRYSEGGITSSGRSKTKRRDLIRVPTTITGSGSRATSPSQPRTSRIIDVGPKNTSF